MKKALKDRIEESRSTCSRCCCDGVECANDDGEILDKDNNHLGYAHGETILCADITGTARLVCNDCFDEEEGD